MKKTKEQINLEFPKRNGFYYFNIDGKELKLPAVTNILQVLNKPALVSWAAKSATKIALDDPSLSEQEVLSKFYAISRDAAERGKRIHSLFQAILTTPGLDLDKIAQDDLPYAQAIINFIQEYKVKNIEKARQVRSLKYGYAGTCDEIVETATETMLIDLKTGGVYAEAGLQLECYKVALEEEGFKIDKTAVLQVPGDGTFALIETKGDMEVFLALKRVWEWIEAKK